MKLGRFLIFSLGLGLLLFFAFPIRQVDCQLNEAALETGVCAEIQQRFLGRSFFFTNIGEDEIWQQLLLDEKYSQNYQLQSLNKTLPGKISLLLSSQLPDYRLRLSDGSSYLLTESNKLKTDRTGLELVEITYLPTEEITRHGYLDNYMQEQFLSLVRAINQAKVPVQNISWRSDQQIELELSGRSLTVILDNSANFAWQIKRLALILADETVSETLSGKSQLDLRFNLPVLR